MFHDAAVTITTTDKELTLHISLISPTFDMTGDLVLEPEVLFTNYEEFVTAIFELISEVYFKAVEREKNECTLQ